MKLNRLIVTLVVLAVVSVAAIGQETEGEAFLLELSAELSEIGWDDDVVADFEEAAGDLDWSGAENADPKLVAAALAYGMPETALALQTQVQMAQALAIHTATMTRLGYSERDIAAATMQATRTMAEEMSQQRSGAGDPDVGEMMQARLNEATEALQTRTMSQSRGANASGSTYGGSESDPPRPGDPAATADGPAADGTGDRTGPRN